MKRLLKVIAMFLSVLTLMSVFSCATPVYAGKYNDYLEKIGYRKKLLSESVENESEKAEILCEVPEKRDEYSKTYKRADGSLTTVFSQTPLHKNENGEWKEINNELKETDKHIENKDGCFNVYFPNKLTEDNKITIENGKDNLSFSLNDIDGGNAVVAEKPNETENIIENDLDKPVSKITYENIDKNTDVEYIVSSSSVKENIIVANKESLKDSYSFTIEKGNLSATLDNENNLIFKNAKNKIVYKIPAPVMTDADNGVSNNIQVNISNETAESLTLTYIPSREWLNNAKYPVKIDPVITVVSDTVYFAEDTVIKYDSTDPTAQATNFEEDYYGCVCATEDIKSEILVKFNIGLFGFLKADNIRPINVVFETVGRVEGGNIIAKTINGSYNMSTITYNDVHPTDGSQPVITYNDEIIDYYIGEYPGTTDGDLKKIQLNITDAFISWLNGGENNGFAILAEDSNTVGELLLDGYFINGYTSETYCTIDYVDTSCTVDEYEYLTQEIGRAGTAYVNTFTRGLSLIRSDLSMQGNIMPASADFHYHGAYNNFLGYLNCIWGLTENNRIILPYGEGWIPSYFMSVATFDDEIYNVFTGEGTVITFIKKEETTIDEETKASKTVTIFEPDKFSDSGYTLELIDETKSVDYINFKLITPNGEVIFFDDGGLVSEIRESEANADGSYDKISLVYDETFPGGIDYVTDGVGRKYDYVYDNDTGLLSYITCLDANGDPIKAGSTQTDLKVSYTYNGDGYLTGVTYPDGKTVSYTYNDGLLTNIKNIDNYNIQYGYDSLGKVTSINEKTIRIDENNNAEEVNGNSITLTELSNRQVKVVDDFSGIQTYQFGADGKLNYIFNRNGNYLKGDFAPCNDENVIKSNDYEINSVNLLKNTSAELTGDWADTNTAGTDIETSRSVTTDEALVGSKSMLVHNTYIKETENANSYFRQDIRGLKPNTSYTVSAYVKTESLAIVNETSASGAYIHYNEYNADGDRLNFGHSDTIQESTKTPEKDEWERVSYTFKTSANSDCVKIYLCLRNATGKAYFDCVQLEEGLGLADYNILQNGSFNNSDESWYNADVVTVDGENAVKLTGGLPSYTEDDGEFTLEDHTSSATQSITVNGKKGDVFSIGGWFKGNFDDNGTDKYFGELSEYSSEQPAKSLAQIKVTYTYEETETDEEGNETVVTTEENFAVDFAPHNEDWQYAEDSFALKGDAEAINVTIIAENIPAEVFARDIALAVDDGAISFEGEDVDSEEVAEDPVISTETDESAETEELSCPCENCEEIDCECICENEEACTCVQCKRRGNIEETSEDGKTITQKSFDGSHYMESSVQYSDDLNYITSETDTNGISTSYSYRNDGTLASQTDSEDVITTYESNAMGYLTLAKVNVSGLSDSKNAMEILYEYDGDLLEKITQGNVLYEYEYDEWGQLKSVLIDNQKIVTYNYGEKENRARLESVCYGNDLFNLIYSYDNGNIVSVTKTGNGSEVVYEYHYDNFGNLKEIIDKGTDQDGEFGHIIYYKENGIIIRDLETEALIYESKDVTPEYDENAVNQPVSATEETVNKQKYTHNVYESAYDTQTGKTTEKEAVIGTKTLGTQTVSDWFGRNESATVMTKDPTDTSATGFTSISSNYLYKTIGNVTTNLITSINNTISGNKNDTVNYNYSYDPDGRITDISTVSSIANLNGSVEYEFDEAGQLVKETKGDSYFEYSYDSKGNITGRKFYSKENVVSEEDDTVTEKYNLISSDIFIYDTNAWEDRLINVCDEESVKDEENVNDEENVKVAVTYDEIGNPTEYFGAELTWFGRELAGYTKGNKAIAYQYDVDGMRYRKVVKENDSVKATYDYVYSDGTLILLTHTTNGVANTARFVYDSFGEPRGFILNDSATYLYLKNGQGDTTAIVGEDGEILVRYEYNAWGAVEFIVPFGVDPALTTILATVSPFTYRGYCYDYDIGMYYLQSRYYDPQICRFINADSTDYLGSFKNDIKYLKCEQHILLESVKSYNLFLYCGNDAIKNTDFEGTDGDDKKPKNLEKYLKREYKCSKTTWGNKRVSVKVSGNNITISANFKISGDLANKKINGYKYAHWFIYGIQKYWKGTFKLFGYKVTLRTYATQFNRSSVSVNMKDTSGVSNTVKATPFQWKRGKDCIINIYKGDTRRKKEYTGEQFAWVSAHEFGHVLGTNDVGETNGNSIMGKFTTRLHARDIERVLLAFRHNVYQTWWKD